MKKPKVGSWPIVKLCLWYITFGIWGMIINHPIIAGIIILSVLGFISAIWWFVSTFFWPVVIMTAGLYIIIAWQNYHKRNN